MDTSPWGGSEALWRSLAEYSLSKRDTVLISVFKWEIFPIELDALKSNGAEIVFRQNTHSSQSILAKVIRLFKKKFSFFNREFKHVLHFKPDHVFINQGGDFDFTINHKALYLLLRKQKIAYSFICHSHQQYSFIPPATMFPFGQEVFRNAKNVFFVSARQLDLTTRKLAMQLKNAVITFNPLNLDVPQSPLPMPTGEIIEMAIVGVLGGAKGQDTAMQVLSKPIWKRRKWRLNLYGVGTGRDYLEKLAVFYDIQDRVIFHGFCNDVLMIWKSSHVLLIPSSWEGMPISMLEALACARPVIATDVGGISEVVFNGENGFIAPSPSVESFQQTLEKAWDIQEEWGRLGINGYKRIKTINLRPHVRVYELLTTGLE